MSKFFIGTSGWVYSSWDKVFYPEDLPYKEKLKYFSKHFKTAEVNYSFYRLPRPETFKNWKNQVPDDFVFSVKASRYITHIKRLKGAEEPTEKFINNAKNLGQKLGPILFQLPPSFKINLERLEKFLKILPKKYRFTFEFRHKSWFTKETFDLLKKYKVALCIADSPGYPKEIRATSSFVYIRMHGSKRLFSSKYTKKELQDLAKLIKKFLKEGKDVYTYFNNDAFGYAVENAREIREMMSYKKVKTEKFKLGNQ